MESKWISFQAVLDCSGSNILVIKVICTVGAVTVLTKLSIGKAIAVSGDVECRGGGDGVWEVEAVKGKCG